MEHNDPLNLLGSGASGSFFYGPEEETEDRLGGEILGNIANYFHHSAVAHFAFLAAIVTETIRRGIHVLRVR